MYTGEEVAKLYKSGNPTLPYYIGASDLLSLLVSPAHIIEATDASPIQEIMM
jgi:hypothetical protein